MGRTLNKAFIAKATPTAGGKPGEFEAIVSAFGVLDSQGDIIDKGAFTKSLAEWVVKGRNIPVVWSHQWSDPDSFIGEYTSAEETDQGLKLKGILDVQDNPRAARVHKLMEAGRIVEFSIGGQVRDWELVEKDDTVEFHITDIDLWEAGPCFKGANPETELLSVKADGSLATGGLGLLMKEGRVLAQKHVDALKTAHSQLGDVIAAVEKREAGEVDEQKSTPSPTPKTGEPDAPKAAQLDPSTRALLELTEIP